MEGSPHLIVYDWSPVIGDWQPVGRQDAGVEVLRAKSALRMTTGSHTTTSFERGWHYTAEENWG
jgi:hypothetical protein